MVDLILYSLLVVSSKVTCKQRLFGIYMKTKVVQYWSLLTVLVPGYRLNKILVNSVYFTCKC